MGVRVRLSRNTSAYFPFWLALPVLVFVGAFWAVALALLAVLWLLRWLLWSPVLIRRRLNERALRAIAAQKRQEIQAAERLRLLEIQAEAERRRADQRYADEMTLVEWKSDLSQGRGSGPA